MDHPRFRFRWWQFLIIGLVVIIAGAFLAGSILRHQGKAAYQAIVDTERAAGRPGTIDDMLDTWPPCPDQAAQTAWENWLKASMSKKKDLEPYKSHCAWDNWLVYHGQKPALPENGPLASMMKDGCALLIQGQLIMNGSEAAKAACPKGKRAFQHLWQTNAEGVRDWNFIWNMAGYLRHEAVFSDQPNFSLAALEVLARGFHTPFFPLDALRSNDMDTERDLVYVELALAGRLSPEIRDFWLAEPLHAKKIMAEAFRLCRLVGIDASITTWNQLGPLDGFVYFRELFSGAWSDVANNVRDCFYYAGVTAAAWSICHRDSALVAQSYLHASARLSEQNRDPLHWPTSINEYVKITANTYQMVHWPFYALVADARHRATRLAVRLLAMPEFPVNQAALEAQLGDVSRLHPGGDQFALRYERLAPDRFRLCIDTVAPVPDFVDPIDLAPITKALTAPASQNALEWDLRIGPFEVQRPKP